MRVRAMKLGLVTGALAVGALAATSLPAGCLFPDLEADGSNAFLCDGGPGSRCVDAPPASWEGPVHTFIGHDPGSCPQGYEQVDGPYLVDTPTCDCACQDDSAAACEKYGIAFYASDVCAAGARCDLEPEPKGGCYQFQTGTCDHAMLDPHPDAGCTPEKESVPVEYGTRAMLCRQHDRGFGCGSERTCLPAEEKDCYFKRDYEGDCFEGGTDRRVAYLEIEDPRACACSCETTCDVTVRKGTSCDLCERDKGNPLNPSSCQDVGDSGTAGFDYCDVQASCEATDQFLEGEVSRTGPVTICCR
ncbi:MAG: hypothetical protein WKG00_04160 [Polyangiaceae bacterium]